MRENYQPDLFHNTLPLRSEEYAAAESAAISQQERVLAVFSNHPASEFTPFEVQILAQMQHCPITSVRRSISNLERDGKLIKTGTMRMGLYGMKNNCWQYKTPI